MADPHAESERPRHPARKWVVATVVMAAAAIGLGIWAFTLRSDVEDKDAQIAAHPTRRRARLPAGACSSAARLVAPLRRPRRAAMLATEKRGGS